MFMMFGVDDRNVSYRYVMELFTESSDNDDDVNIANTRNVIVDMFIVMRCEYLLCICLCC